MLARKLIDIPLKVLRADLVEGALVSAFQHLPEGLHAVRVSLTVHILADRVIDGLVLEVAAQPDLALLLVGIDRRARFGVLADEASQRLAGRVGNDLGPNLVGLAILDADNRRLARHAAPGASLGQFPALGEAHVVAPQK